MSITERMWDTLATVIRMNDKVVTMSVQMAEQQRKIEDLTARVIRLETALEIVLARRPARRIERR